jgi:hypothetical protein
VSSLPEHPARTTTPTAATAAATWAEPPIRRHNR